MIYAAVTSQQKFNKSVAKSTPLTDLAWLLPDYLESPIVCERACFQFYWSSQANLRGKVILVQPDQAFRTHVSYSNNSALPHVNAFREWQATYWQTLDGVFPNVVIRNWIVNPERTQKDVVQRVSIEYNPETTSISELYTAQSFVRFALNEFQSMTWQLESFMASPEMSTEWLELFNDMPAEFMLVLGFARRGLVYTAHVPLTDFTAYLEHPYGLPAAGLRLSLRQMGALFALALRDNLRTYKEEWKTQPSLRESLYNHGVSKASSNARFLTTLAPYMTQEAGRYGMLTEAGNAMYDMREAGSTYSETPVNELMRLRTTYLRSLIAQYVSTWL